ncbi:MAG: DUF3667 domain-containing protein [Bacteroidota bacterium]
MNPPLQPMDSCMNCGRSLDPTDAYCPSCGQKNVDRKVPFWVFLGEFVGKQFRLDGKWWRSLKPFLIRPGFLTNEFIAGRRKRYAPPIQFFLFIGFFCFLLVNKYFDREVSQQDIEKGNFRITVIDKEEIDNMLEEYIYEQAIKAQQNPKDFFQQIFKQIPIVLLLVLPMYAVLLRGFYFRSGIFLVEHLVFLLHTHAFLFVLLGLNFLLAMLGVYHGTITLICLAIFLVYLFMSMRRVYQKRRLKIVLHLILLGLCYVLIVPFFLISGGFFAGLLS